MPVLLAKAKAPSTQPILDAAFRMQGKLRTAYLAAVKRVKDSVTLERLSEAVARQDLTGLLAILAVDKKFTDALQGAGLEANITSLKDAIQQTFAAGAKAAVKMLPVRVSTELSFDLMNPEAVRFLNTYTFDLIRSISQESRDAIQQIVTRAFREGGHPFQQARQIREVIGLTPRMEQAVANYRSALESGNLKDALSRALRDGRYDRSLLSALESERAVNPERIDRMVSRYADRYLDYRARNIARTESLRASNQGQRELWRQAREQQLLPRDVQRVWIVGNDPCPICEELDGETVGMDEEFAEGDPPIHPSCVCTTAIDADSLDMAA